MTQLQAFLSSVLQIKPLLKIAQGRVEFVAKVRTRRESMNMLLNEFKTLVATETKSIISIMHTAAEEDALKLKAAVEDTFKNAGIIINQAGPVLGTHAGPRALALIAVPLV